MNNYDEFLNKILNLINDHKFSLTEEDIFNFLKITNRWPIRTHNNVPTVEIITQWGHNYVQEIFNSNGFLIFDEWKKTYDSGFTSILSDVLDLSSELRDLNQKIYNFSGKKTHANFYFSKGSKEHRVSFDHHYHDYDVIVKMIYGKCIWKIGDDYVKLENNTILIPSKTFHSVVECDERKLSLTINLM